MPGDIKIKYPASNADTSNVTITLTSLAASTTGVAGRESTAVNNTSNLDIDHLVSGKTAIQSNATVGAVEVWAYSYTSISTTPAYNKVTGSDANVTFDSRNQVVGALRLLWSQPTDASVARAYYMPPTSVAQAFGGQLPPYWGLVVIDTHGGALSATAGDHQFVYQRVQAQYT